MTDKSQELELKLVMEGMEEFATMLSYASDYKQLCILSVETVEEAMQRELAEKSANVITLESRRRQSLPTNISKSLRFQDRHFHS